MSAVVLRADARHLPLPDASVDLIVTSPPYFGLRSYTDGCTTCSQAGRQRMTGYTERYCPACGNVEQGRIKCNRCGTTTRQTEASRTTAARTDCPDCGGTGRHHYEGQIGSEATPAEFVAALLDCTREWVRVLKPSGSLFVNLGDKYSQRTQTRRSSHQPGIFPGKFPEFAETWAERAAQGAVRMPHQNVTDPASGAYVPEKSLMGLPWRYALGCIDQLGLILRAEIVWAKPNGLPESVTDRVRRSHEQVFHFTRLPRYFAAVDEIREPYAAGTAKRYAAGYSRTDYQTGQVRVGQGVDYSGTFDTNPLGKLPGSVWEIPSAPLTVPAHLGVDHFAAFPPALVRPIVLGWSPAGICTRCGEGRRPVAAVANIEDRKGRKQRIVDLAMDGAHGPDGRGGERWKQTVRITGYACACTPFVPHEKAAVVLTDTDTGEPFTAEPARMVRAYDFRNWTPAPTRPAVVLDPFGGTGTTALVASVYGRHGITADMSADYCRLAQWRTRDPAERARAMDVPKPPPIPDGQTALFT